MNIELITPNDSKWAEFLFTVKHDFYHLPQYVDLESKRIAGKACAIYAKDGDRIFFLPLILKSFISPPLDRLSRYLLN